MIPTNYFKVHTPRTERTFAFDTWDRKSIRAAFNRATMFSDALRGTLSVFYRVPLSGPWDCVAVIAADDAPLPVFLRPVRKAVPVCSFGESWAY